MCNESIHLKNFYFLFFKTLHQLILQNKEKQTHKKLTVMRVPAAIKLTSSNPTKPQEYCVFQLKQFY